MPEITSTADLIEKMPLTPRLREIASIGLIENTPLTSRLPETTPATDLIENIPARTRLLPHPYWLDEGEYACAVIGRIRAIRKIRNSLLESEFGGHRDNANAIIFAYSNYNIRLPSPGQVHYYFNGSFVKTSNVININDILEDNMLLTGLLLRWPEGRIWVEGRDERGRWFKSPEQ